MMAKHNKSFDRDHAALSDHVRRKSCAYGCILTVEEEMTSF